MQIVNKTEFSKLEAMIPSLPEQKIIGTFSVILTPLSLFISVSMSV
ncbi:hypothetical protein [Bifidobacterium canis]